MPTTQVAPFTIRPLRSQRRRASEGAAPEGPTSQTPLMLQAAEGFRQALMQAALLDLQEQELDLNKRKFEVDEALSESQRRSLDIGSQAAEAALTESQTPEAVAARKQTTAGLATQATATGRKMTAEATAMELEGTPRKIERTEKREDIFAANIEAQTSDLKYKIEAGKAEVLTKERDLKVAQIEKYTGMLAVAPKGTFAYESALQLLNKVDDPDAKALASVARTQTFQDWFEPKSPQEALGRFLGRMMVAVEKSDAPEDDKFRSMRFIFGLATDEYKADLEAIDKMDPGMDLDLKRKMTLERMQQHKDTEEEVARILKAKGKKGHVSTERPEVTNMLSLGRPDLAKKIRNGIPVAQAVTELTATEKGILARIQAAAPGTAAGKELSTGELNVVQVKATEKAKRETEGKDKQTIAGLREFFTSRKFTPGLASWQEPDYRAARNPFLGAMMAETKEDFISRYKKARLASGATRFISSENRQTLEEYLVKIGWLDMSDFREAGRLGKG